MPPRDDLIIIIDLEATGSNKNGDDEIVEIGCVMLDAHTLAEVGSYSSLVSPLLDASWQRMLATPVVRKMHEASGIIAEMAQVQYRELIEAPRVEAHAIAWLDAFVRGDTTHIPYGGSGVAWYDRKLIDRQMPKFAKRLSYWAYDVASIRRTALLAGRTDWPQPTGKTHRALDDARHHADEFRFAVDLLRPVEAEISLP